MILRKVFFILILSVPALWANLRAPVHIDRGGSELKGEKAALKILGETLEFQCPDAYTGKVNFELFAARACNTRIRYRILAEKDEKVKLTFVFAGTGNVTWSYRDKVGQSQAKPMKVDDRRFCTFCPDHMKQLLIAEQVFEFEKGEGELAVIYRQALSYDERGHGYFSDSKWTQGFTYELWPIAEWQWAAPVSANIKFSIGARSGFLGIGYKDDKMQCFVTENEAQKEIPLTIAPVQNERRVATAQVPLAKKPLRLHCSYGAD